MKGYDPFVPDAGLDAEPVFDAPPPRPRGANIEGMRKALMRSNTRLLLSTVMLFQFTAMLLISLQERPVDTQALILAVALPAATWLVVMAFGASGPSTAPSSSWRCCSAPWASSRSRTSPAPR